MNRRDGNAITDAVVWLMTKPSADDMVIARKSAFPEIESQPPIAPHA